MKSETTSYQLVGREQMIHCAAVIYGFQDDFFFFIPLLPTNDEAPDLFSI